MLAVEGVLALDGADMPAGAQVFGGLDKSAGNIVIGDGRELNGHILAGGALHTNGTVGDDKIAAHDLEIDAAGGANADEGAPMAVEGPPMPVDMTMTVSPSTLPSQVVYSRCWQ